MSCGYCRIYKKRIKDLERIVKIQEDLLGKLKSQPITEDEADEFKEIVANNGEMYGD